MVGSIGCVVCLSCRVLMKALLMDIIGESFHQYSVQLLASWLLLRAGMWIGWKYYTGDYIQEGKHFAV